MDAKRIAPRHIIIKMPKVKGKEKVLKAAREKKRVTYKGVPIRLSVDFSKETLQAIRDWQKIFKEKKSKDLQPRLLYPGQLSLRIKEQIREFPRQEKANKQVHHHQTSITRNVKWSSLRRRMKDQ